METILDREYSVIERMWIKEAIRFTKHSDEIWAVDSEIPGYVVSSYGQIYSFRSHRLLKPSWTKDGCYFQVTLRINGENYCFGVHRLLAIVFFGLPDYPVDANHIDGDGLNNHISNLEWLTPEENQRYTREVLRRPQRWREQVSGKGVEQA